MGGKGLGKGGARRLVVKKWEDLGNKGGGHVNETFFSQRDCHKKMLELDGRCIDRHPQYQNDIEMVQTAVKEDSDAMLSVDGELRNELRNNRDFMQLTNGNGLKHASEELKSDKELVLVLVKLNGDALLYASEELKNDKEVVLETVKRDGAALGYASEELLNDKEVVLEAVKQDWWALLYASEELQNDKEVMLEAVKQNGRALYHASEELKNDKEVVLEAVKQNGSALCFASQELKQEFRSVMRFVRSNKNTWISTKNDQASSKNPNGISQAHAKAFTDDGLYYLIHRFVEQCRV